MGECIAWLKLNGATVLDDGVGLFVLLRQGDSQAVMRRRILGIEMYGLSQARLCQFRLVAIKIVFSLKNE